MRADGVKGRLRRPLRGFALDPARSHLRKLGIEVKRETAERLIRDGLVRPETAWRSRKIPGLDTTPPCGRRRPRKSSEAMALLFQSTPPCGRRPRTLAFARYG